MAGASAYLKLALMKEIFNNINYAVPTNTYVGLHTADPTEAGTTAEVSTSGTGYVRLLVNKDGATVPFWTTATNTAGVTTVSNNSLLTFAQATGAWGTITNFSVWDAVTAGNCLWTGTLSASKAIGATDTLTFAANQLSATLQ